MPDLMDALRDFIVVNNEAHNALVECCSEVDSFAVTLLATQRLDTEVQDYAFVSLSAVTDLARGAFFQGAENESPGNASRLARHLMEHEWDMAYVLKEDTPERCRQRLVTDYGRALSMIERDWRSIMGDELEDLKQAVLDAEAREAAAGGKKARYTFRRQVPDFYALAHHLGRGGEYEGYRGLSAVSHPGWPSYMLMSAPATPEGAMERGAYAAFTRRRAAYFVTRHYALAVSHVQPSSARCS